MICRKISFQKLIQLSHGNNVLDAAPSNKDGILWRDTWVSSFTWIIIFGAERAYIHLETPKKPKVQEILLQTLTQFSQGNNVLNATLSNIDGFLWTDACVSSTQLNKPNGANRPYIHLETPKFPEVFL
jgi:hypothetical protein